MSSRAETTNPVTRPAELRVRPKWLGPRFPAVVLAVGTVVVVLLWVVPSDELALTYSVVFTGLTGVITALLLTVWFAAFSDISPRIRRTTFVLGAVTVALGVASVRRVDLTGDLIPFLTFRWEDSPPQALPARDRGVEPFPAVVDIDVRDGDMAEYRGPRRDGVIVGASLRRDWEDRLPELVWRQAVGGGHAGFAVAGSVAVTMEQRGSDEAVICYRAATGREVWTHEYSARFQEALGGEGPRATPTIAGGRVYAMGGTGIVTCLDGQSGDRIWSRDLLASRNAENLRWGMAGSPLVFDGMVVVNPGGQVAGGDVGAVVALSAETGDVIWTCGTSPAGYASPMLATFAGHSQILVFDAAGVRGLDCASGDPLWNHPWVSTSDVNAAQPVVLSEERLLISCLDGGTVLELRRTDQEWLVETLWESRTLKCYFSNPVAHGGEVYGLDLGILVCVDSATGKRHWKAGRYGHGQMLLADDLLVILTEKGELVLVEASPEAHRELGRFQAVDARTWNNPALVDGRIYVRNHLEMACYDLR